MQIPSSLLICIICAICVLRGSTNAPVSAFDETLLAGGIGLVQTIVQDLFTNHRKTLHYQDQSHPTYLSSPYTRIQLH